MVMTDRQDSSMDLTNTIWKTEYKFGDVDAENDN
jgi:hypothetical protein